MTVKKFAVQSAAEALEIAGENDSRLRRLERELGVEIFMRQHKEGGGFAVEIHGGQTRVNKAIRRLKERLQLLREQPERPEPSVEPAHARDGHVPEPMNIDSPNLPVNGIYRTASGKIIRPMTANQKRYVDAILNHDLVFGIGPAGTGKTFLAVACALRALELRQVQRVILSRPVVEAGERLGFLPGDLLEKMGPYLKPVYDCFFIMLGPERFRLWRDTETIEIVPLAYMRGRTFEDAFIILDEAQNTTPEQMKMFLTRMGAGSKVVVTGDETQHDLPGHTRSGLEAVIAILKAVEGIAFERLTEADVVRHPIVRKIIRAYQEWEAKK
jgi:phosphate starvation-inducible PhoH-like protein